MAWWWRFWWEEASSTCFGAAERENQMAKTSVAAARAVGRKRVQGKAG